MRLIADFRTWPMAQLDRAKHTQTSITMLETVPNTVKAFTKCSRLDGYSQEIAANELAAAEIAAAKNMLKLNMPGTIALT